MLFDRITQDPDKMNGQPCIRGMGLTIRRILELLATYKDWNEIKREFPELEDEDFQQALEYAASQIEDCFLVLSTNK
jgi:uncharacterized protein (DUF433 family)